MDVFWSVERCGWVPCNGTPDVLATAWPVSEPAPEDLVELLPQQRAEQEPAPVEG